MNSNSRELKIMSQDKNKKNIKLSMKTVQINQNQIQTLTFMAQKQIHQGTVI